MALTQAMGAGDPSLSVRGAAAATAKSLQLCPTLSDPMDCSLPGSAIHGIFQARVLEWDAIAFSRKQTSGYQRGEVREERH